MHARLTAGSDAKPVKKPRAPAFDKLTMGELFERFMASKVDLAPRTVELYRELWDVHCQAQLGAVPVVDLSAWHLDEAYRVARSRLSASSTRKVHKLLSAVLVQGMRWELVSRNVAMLASPPRDVKPEISPPSMCYYAKIVRAADEHQPAFATLVRLAAVTGLRRGELSGVRCRIHDLRHLCGTQMIAAGVDAKPVADRLGHSTPVVTLAFYTHFVSETQRQAADVIGAVVSGL